MAFWIAAVLGTIFGASAFWQILHYRQEDGAARFLLGIVLPFSLGFACFVLAAQVRKRRG